MGSSSYPGTSEINNVDFLYIIKFPKRILYLLLQIYCATRHGAVFRTSVKIFLNCRNLSNQSFYLPDRAREVPAKQTMIVTIESKR